MIRGTDAMKIKSPIANWLIARVATWLLRLLFLTARVEHHSVAPEGTPNRKPKLAQRYCFCLWHDAIIVCVYSLKTWFLGGLISRHQDGTYLAHAAKLAGITPVRGSASRGGAPARPPPSHTAPVGARAASSGAYSRSSDPRAAGSGGAG